MPPRAISSQVVEGWLRVIQANRIVVACDQACADSLQIGLMRLAVPEGVEVDVLSVRAAAEGLAGDVWKTDRVLLLLPSPVEARRLVEAGVKLPSLNLGGLHDAPGRRMVTPRVSLGEEDLRDLRWLESHGVSLDVRPLPGDPSQTLDQALAEESSS
jgi:PTS system mannose-specific IIB component